MYIFSLINRLMNELSWFLRRSWLCLQEGVNKNIRSAMSIEGSGNGETSETPSFPKTDRHGDYLAYLGQKN